jgi:hypothetical protein
MEGLLGARMKNWVNFKESGHETPKHCIFSLLAVSVCLTLLACSANSPGSIETMVAQEAKRAAIAGKNLKNPLPYTPETTKNRSGAFRTSLSGLPRTGWP